MIGETWRDIKGFEGQYQVSDAGRVRSLLNNKRNLRQEPKILALKPNRGGYLTVGLASGSTVRTFAVHRLVIETFGTAPQSGDTCDHINRIRTDNRLENLRWLSAAQQCENRATPGRKGEAHHRAKLNEDSVRSMRALRSAGASLAALSDQFGVNVARVSAVCTGRAWGHVGADVALRGDA